MRKLQCAIIAVFMIKQTKKCTIEGKPMGIVGLPCQQTITCSATENGIK